MVDEFIEKADAFVGTAAQLLKLEGKEEEVEILVSSDVGMKQTDYDNWDGGIYLYTLYLQIPQALFTKYASADIKKLEESILEKIQTVVRPLGNDWVSTVIISPKVIEEKDWRKKVLRLPVVDIIRMIEEQRELMIAVATGGPRINDKNGEYIKRRQEIAEALKGYDINDPCHYNDLWAWYSKWSSGDLPNYRSRREFIHSLFNPLIEKLRKNESSPEGMEIFEEPTGWTKVDRDIGEVRRRLEEAENEIQYQAIGVLCRETFVTLAQTIYDPTKHRTAEEEKPSPSQSKNMFDAFIKVEISGSENEQLRRHVKSAVDLANELTHKRTADFRLAALCAHVTASVANTFAIITGQRDP